MPRVSIIIPFQAPSAYLAETLQHIARLTVPAHEVILLPDGPLPEGPVDLAGLNARVLPTGPVSPAIKRDQGAEAAAGEILAFIDDDAYPAPDWLERATPHFAAPNVAAVGGPQITPPGDSFWQQVSGAVFLSCLNGAATRRYRTWDGKMDVDDWPSVNLCVRKEDFLAVGGFDSTYWPGEDTKLCHDLAHVLDRRIVADGRAVVFHHRRAGLRKHLRQVGGYGLHRGHFVRRFPATSRRPAYFAPSAFFLFAITSGLSLWAGGALLQLYTLGWALYTSALMASVVSIWLQLRKPLVALATIPFTVGTHFWYGYRFLQGLMNPYEIKGSLGR
jgi:GT2 family glycosyltransferase